jgi:hypothetical protein
MTKGRSTNATGEEWHRRRMPQEKRHKEKNK